MRKSLLVLSAAAAIGMAAPAAAHPLSGPGHYAPVAAGVVVGTVVGVGLHNGWFGATALPTSSAGAAAAGFVAGVGTVALIDALTQPCRGFRAMFGGGGCVNGKYVGH